MKGKMESMSKSKLHTNQRAVALRYDDGAFAPVIIASGMGHIAEKIVETAVEHNVPVYEDNSLATILSRLELGQEIPEELFQVIVDIYVYFLNYSPKGVPSKKEAAMQTQPQEETEQIDEEFRKFDEE